jgi:hypothetical protein
MNHASKPGNEEGVASFNCTRSLMTLLDQVLKTASRPHIPPRKRPYARAGAGKTISGTRTQYARMRDKDSENLPFGQ